MIAFPCAKINIGLYITEKRADGYHNLQTIFYPIPLTDVLEITPSHDHSTHCTLYGTPIEGSTDSNLIMRAYKALRSDFNIPPLHIHLLKYIPTGAGMGGGSADGAYALRLINDYCQLKLSDKQLASYAALLGADCPFFIYNSPLYAEGIGNEFTNCTLSLRNYQLFLVKPSIHISTQQAYANVKPQKPQIDLCQQILQPITTWRETVRNDFEESVFPAYPLLKQIKEELYNQGALYAAMSGSGSTIYGIFPEQASIMSNASLFHDCFTQRLQL